MKPSPLIVFLILVFYMPVKAQKTAKVIIDLNDCRMIDSENTFQSVHRLYFYKLPEDSFVLKVSPMEYRNGSITLDSLPVADYQLKYKNHYGQDAEKIITIEAQKINRVIICADKLQQYPHNTIKKIQEGDSILVSYLTEGCFHMGLKNKGCRGIII